MYARYTHSAAATADQIFKDLCDIIGGVTDVNLLSAGCVKASTEIRATKWASPWVATDAGTASARVFRGSMVTVPGTSLCIRLSYSGTAISLAVGTDSANSGATLAGTTYTHPSTYAMPALGNVRTYNIFASPLGLLLGSEASTAAPILATEFASYDLWRNAATGCLPFMVYVPGTGTNMSNYLRYTPGTTFLTNMGVVLKACTGAGTFANAGTLGTNINIGPAGTGGVGSMDAAGTAVVPHLRRIDAIAGVVSTPAQHLYQQGGSVTDVFPMYDPGTASSLTSLDSLMFGTEEYRVIGSGASAYKFAVPYG